MSVKFQSMTPTQRGNNLEPSVVYRVSGARNLIHLNKAARALFPRDTDGRQRVSIEYAPGGHMRITSADAKNPRGRLVNERTGQVSVVKLTDLPGWKDGLRWRLKKDKSTTLDRYNCIRIDED